METLLHLGLSNAVLATLLALLAAGASRLLRRPALCHILWLLVFLKLVTPPLYHILLPWSVPPTTPREETSRRPPSYAESPAFVGPPAPASLSSDTTETAETPAGETPVVFPSWEVLVATLWLTGSGVWWTVAAYRLLRFRRMLRHARPAPVGVREQARRLAERIGLTRCPTIWFLPASVSPMLWALGWTPRLLLPAELWDALTEEQRDCLLVHELAHLRRRDHWVRRLELLVLGLYWWHPVVWWARLRLQDAEEECCDAWVTWALPEAGPAYASALVETVAFLSAARTVVPLGANGGGQSRHLRRRLTMILRGTTFPRPHWLAFAGVLVLAVLVLPVGSAQQPRDEKGERTDFPPPRDTKDDKRELPVKVDEKRKIANPARNELIEQARDEVELLEVQLEVKKAQFEAAELSFQQAKERVGRLAKDGTVPAAALAQAQQEVDSAKVQLVIKRAELREPEVRLQQAKRRLERLEQAAKDPEKETAEERRERLEKLGKQLEALEKQAEALRIEIRRLNPPDKDRELKPDYRNSK
jgi:beta-lactamase regulating signal transducer with metallopeptidase domain